MYVCVSVYIYTHVGERQPGARKEIKSTKKLGARKYEREKLGARKYERKN
jgi:hypothetical protein